MTVSARGLLPELSVSHSKQGPAGTVMNALFQDSRPAQETRVFPLSQALGRHYLTSSLI